MNILLKIIKKILSFSDYKLFTCDDLCENSIYIYICILSEIQFKTHMILKLRATLTFHKQNKKSNFATLNI